MLMGHEMKQISRMENDSFTNKDFSQMGTWLHGSMPRAATESLHYLLLLITSKSNMGTSTFPFQFIREGNTFDYYSCRLITNLESGKYDS